MNRLETVTTVASLALLGAMLAPSVKADEYNNRTVVTFSNPEEIREWLTDEPEALPVEVARLIEAVELAVAIAPVPERLQIAIATPEALRFTAGAAPMFRLLMMSAAFAVPATAKGLE